MEFKDRIKEIRLDNGLSPTDLASRFGKSESAVRMWEAGKSKPDADTLIKLSQTFDCTIDYLLGLNATKSITEMNIALTDFEEFASKFNMLPLKHKENVIMVAEYIVEFYHEFVNFSDVIDSYSETISFFEAVLALELSAFKKLYEEKDCNALLSFVCNFLNREKEILQIGNEFADFLKEKIKVDFPQLLENADSSLKEQIDDFFAKKNSVSK